MTPRRGRFEAHGNDCAVSWPPPWAPQSMHTSTVFVIRSLFTLVYMVALLEWIRLWVAANLSVLISELSSIQMFIHYQMSSADKLQASLSTISEYSGAQRSASALCESPKYFAG